MGVEADTMSIRGLALSIPPVFAAYTVGQMIARMCQDRWGVPIFSHAECQEDPSKAALLQRWVQGAGLEDGLYGMRRVSAEETAEQRPDSSGSAPPGEETEQLSTDDDSDADTDLECDSDSIDTKSQPRRGTTRESTVPEVADDVLARAFYEPGGRFEAAPSPVPEPKLSTDAGPPRLHT